MGVARNNGAQVQQHQLREQRAAVGPLSHHGQLNQTRGAGRGQVFEGFSINGTRVRSLADLGTVDQLVLATDSRSYETSPSLEDSL